MTRPSICPAWLLPPSLASTFFLAALLTPLSGAAAPPALTIERVVTLAAERNERTGIAAAEAEAAAFGVNRARAFFFPELTIGGTVTRRLHETVRTVGGRTAVIQRHVALGAQANVTVPLFDARLFPLYRQAKLERQSAELTAADERRLVGFEAADAFLMVLSQEQVAVAAARRLEFSRATLRDARARAEAGLVSSNDVTRAELETATAERELAAARASAATARLELGQLVASDASGPLAAPDALLGEATKPPPAAEAVIAEGVSRRLDVAAGKSRALALAAAAEEPGRRAIPSLAAVGQYRVTNEGGLSGRVGDGYVGLSAQWSLFDGGDRRAEGGQRRALAAAASLEQDARVRAIALDARRALVALENAQTTQGLAARAVEVARRNVAEAAELYRQGLGRAIELADANLRLFEAEVALARERYALSLAHLDLRAAAGQVPPGLVEKTTGKSTEKQ